VAASLDRLETYSSVLVVVDSRVAVDAELTDQTINSRAVTIWLAGEMDVPHSLMVPVALSAVVLV